MEEEDEESSEELILSIGKDGKASLHKPEDYVEVKEEDTKIIQSFLKENKRLFKRYCDKHITKNTSNIP